MATDTRLFLLSTVCGVLLLMCSPPLTAASLLPTAYKRALQELDSKPQLIRAELIHRDHRDSPLSFAKGTTPYAATPSQKARIARCLRTGLEFTTPLSYEDVPHATDAEYVMTLYLRTPPQKFLVIVDTGSDLVWVQCQPCTSPHQCYNQTENPFFDPYASISYSAVPCTDNSTCNPLLHPTPLDSAWCPFWINPSTYYWANMTGITIDGNFSLSIPEAPFQYNSTTGSAGTIFHSGTSLMYLSQDIYTPAVQILQDSITYPVVPDPTSNNLTCYNIRRLQQPHYPSITLHFSEVNARTEDLLLTDSEKLFFRPPGDDVECLALHNQGIKSPNIIGNVAQANHYVQYDLVNIRIGWISTDCSPPLI